MIIIMMIIIMMIIIMIISLRLRSRSYDDHSQLLVCDTTRPVTEAMLTSVLAQRRLKILQNSQPHRDISALFGADSALFPKLFAIRISA